jgi:hypothetical protein
MLADVGYDASNLVYRTVSGIVGLRSKLRRQQMPAAENVQRQLAVTVVVAVLAHLPTLRSMNWQT